ncbi:impB/mucB/samB family protein, partial [Escherichia coli]
PCYSNAAVEKLSLPHRTAGTLLPPHAEP